MARDERPLFERLSDAADVLAEVAETEPWRGVTVSMAKAAHHVASQFQQDAVDAAERDQLIEDVAAFLYRGVVSNGDSNLDVPAWGQLPPDSAGRRYYRNLAEHLMVAFDIRRVEAPFYKMAASDMTYCPRCQQMFADTDNTGVCPHGHETRDLDDDEYPIGQVQI